MNSRKIISLKLALSLVSTLRIPLLSLAYVRIQKTFKKGLKGSFLTCWHSERHFDFDPVNEEQHVRLTQMDCVKFRYVNCSIALHFTSRSISHLTSF